jgi:S-methylmethionine-dependent homocysteine/selenocysteine methylase
MDSVSRDARREALHEKIENAQATLRRAAAAAVIQNDPLSEQLRAVAISIGALADIYDASEDTHREIADTLKNQTERVTKESISQVHASGVSIIDQLTPRLIEEVRRVTRANVRTFRLRTVMFGAAGMMAAVAVVGWLSFTAGESSGVTKGEVVAQTINAAMAAGPGTAAAWSLLMANNDPVQALAACEKSEGVASDGQHYCSMPVWLDRKITPN